MKKTTKKCENCGKNIKIAAYIQTKMVCPDCFKEMKKKWPPRQSYVPWMRETIESLRKACRMPQLSKIRLLEERDDE